MLESLWRGVAATSLAEWVAVATGVVYILLIVRHNRWGWVAGAVSSSILMVLAARARLPMQALLQFSYVVIAAYGWWHWKDPQGQRRIGFWPLRRHVLVWMAALAASFGLAQLLAREGASAFPFVDSLVACGGLFASWLTARLKVENWLYWMVIDVTSFCLFVAQALPVTALLFAIYFGISVRGWFAWRRRMAAGPAVP